MFNIGDVLEGSYGMKYVIYNVNRSTYDVIPLYEVEHGYKHYSQSRYKMKQVDCWKLIDHIDLVKAVEAPTVAYRVGDILFESWGYEQTNIDFFQVIKSTNKTVWVRKIQKEKKEHDMRGTCMPIKDSFNSDILRFKIHMLRGIQFANAPHGTLRLWDGKPKEYTCYA